MVRPRKYDITDKEILHVVTTSRSWKEVTERTGYAPTALYPRVANWKAEGVLADAPVAVLAEFWEDDNEE